MKKLFNSFWFLLAIFLSLLFAIIFYPEALEWADEGEALMFTIAGILVIWIVFFLQARIFSKKK